MKSLLRYLLFTIIIVSSKAYAADINGFIGVTNRGGDLRYGSHIEVNLIREPIGIMSICNQTYTDTMREIFADSIARTQKMCYQGTLDSFREKDKADPKFVAASAKSNLEGKFKLTKIKPGKYYLFTMGVIADQMCCWQVPVEIGKKNFEIELSNDNFAMAPFN